MPDLTPFGMSDVYLFVLSTVEEFGCACVLARLFLSHRTVGGYLHRALPKLGVETRAALRDALESLPRAQLPRN